ncbi:MAG: 4-hydroxy-tetrahydrodipicolinate synthase [Myxococcota bacterium]
MRLEGTFTALVTPFRSDGALDLDALTSLVEWQIESGIEGLVPCGSTGEAATLSHAEHTQIVRHVVEVAAGRVPVIAGTGSNSTREAVELTAQARRAGAEAALLISPYYVKPTQEGIFHHYRTVAEETGLPVVLYNIPGRTASRIEPETAARLARVPGVLGLKECGGDLVATSRVILQAGEEFSVLSGDDALTLPMLAIGARGAISTTANLYPVEMRGITEAFRAGDGVRARELHERLMPIMGALFLESNPIPVKTALFLRGRIPDAALRLPLTPMSKPNRDRLEAALDAIGPQ